MTVSIWPSGLITLGCNENIRLSFYLTIPMCENKQIFFVLSGFVFFVFWDILLEKRDFNSTEESIPTTDIILS